jgi:hypothetical protein
MFPPSPIVCLTEEVSFHKLKTILTTNRFDSLVAERSHHGRRDGAHSAVVVDNNNPRGRPSVPSILHGRFLRNPLCRTQCHGAADERRRRVMLPFAVRSGARARARRLRLPRWPGRPADRARCGRAAAGGGGARARHHLRADGRGNRCRHCRPDPSLRSVAGPADANVPAPAGLSGGSEGTINLRTTLACAPGLVIGRDDGKEEGTRSSERLRKAPALFARVPAYQSTGFDSRVPRRLPLNHLGDLGSFGR